MIDVTIGSFTVRIPVRRAGDPVPWFMDVDGVLNACSTIDDGPWPDYRRAMVNGGTRDWPIKWSPTVVHVINLLQGLGHVQIQWLTTWGQHANEDLSATLGIEGPNPVALQPPPSHVDDLRWWKLAAIERHIAEDGGPFIWTDDDIVYEPRARALAELQGPAHAMILTPHTSLGLTPAELRDIVNWVVQR